MVRVRNRRRGVRAEVGSTKSEGSVARIECIGYMMELNCWNEKNEWKE